MLTLYDTTSAESTFMANGAQGAQIFSNYDPQDSKSAKTEEDSYNYVDFGKFQVNGPKVNDEVCFFTENHTCIKEFPFVSSQEITGDFEGQAVIGLAPSSDPMPLAIKLFHRCMTHQPNVALRFQRDSD